jgi:hypothetical protein
MEFDTGTAARYAGEKLDLLLARAVRDSATVTEQGEIPKVVKHFDQLRDIVRDLVIKVTALTKHVETLSEESIPNLFSKQGVKSVNVIDLGRVTINIRWSASMLDKGRGLEWLRGSGNEGLIIETVNAQTLGAFAKTEAIGGRPLPDDVFKTSTKSYVSITAV